MIREFREIREIREEAYCTALPLLKLLNFPNNINAPQQTTDHQPTQQTLSSTMATPTAKGRPLSLNALALLWSLGRLGRLERLGNLGRLVRLVCVVLSGGGVEIIPYSFLTVTKYRYYSASIKIYFLSLLYYFEIISTS